MTDPDALKAMVALRIFENGDEIVLGNAGETSIMHTENGKVFVMDSCQYDAQFSRYPLEFNAVSVRGIEYGFWYCGSPQIAAWRRP